MRCSRRKTSKVPTQCYALARYKSTTRKITNAKTLCYFDSPDATSAFPSPQVAHLQPSSQKLSESDTKFVPRIRNTLILGLVHNSWPLSPGFNLLFLDPEQAAACSDSEEHERQNHEGRLEVGAVRDKANGRWPDQNAGIAERGDRRDGHIFRHDRLAANAT
ncbi:MAG: hypothetical protein QOI53_4431, partial [Verrucomicrobiota bacterium]|nr:hypothetical protein [Verrucomicrobiota bacterium]